MLLRQPISAGWNSMGYIHASRKRRQGSVQDQLLIRVTNEVRQGPNRVVSPADPPSQTYFCECLHNIYEHLGSLKFRQFFRYDLYKCRGLYIFHAIPS